MSTIMPGFLHCESKRPLGTEPEPLSIRLETPPRSSNMPRALGTSSYTDPVKIIDYMIPLGMAVAGRQHASGSTGASSTEMEAGFTFQRYTKHY